MKNKKTTKMIITSVLALAMSSVFASTTVLASAAKYSNTFTSNSAYKTEYSSIQEVAEASEKIANQITAEGTVLLKNDGSLPLTGDDQRISIFGSHSGGMNGLQTNLQDLGFKVNMNSVIGTGNVGENDASLPKNYTDNVKRNNEVEYNDAAIVVFSQAFGAVSGENSGFGFIQNAPVRSKESSSSKGGTKTQVAEGEGTGNGIVDPGDASVEDFKDADGNNYILPSGSVFQQKNLAYTIYDNTEQRYITIYEDDYDLADTDRYTVEYYKHPLMLSEAAEEIISYTTSNFDTVIVLFMSANQLEVGILEENPGISAILWSGDRDSKTSSAGRNNMEQIAKIITGEINPSGRTINTWARDFTNASTWMNDGNSGITYASIDGKDASEWEAERIFHGSSFAMGLRDENGNYYIRAKRVGNNKRNYALPVMYEEDIYMGYRYYETAAAEAAADNYAGYIYEDEVVYPFGHGLSYTTFEKEIVSVDDTAWEDMTTAGWSVQNWKNNGEIIMKVRVTNTGKYAGKEVVQVYAHAPYYVGGVAKSEVVLAGFEKTKTLAPGASQIVTVTVKVNDLASYDWSDANGNGKTTYELDKNAATDTAGNPLSASSNGGKYELRVQDNSHDIVDVYELADLTKDVLIDTSATTGNEITNVFSEGSLEDSLSYDPATKKNMVEEGKMTLLSRADFAGTWPEMSTPADMMRSNEFFDLLDASNDFNADSFYTSNELLVQQTSEGCYDNTGSSTYEKSTSNQDAAVIDAYYDLYLKAQGKAGSAADTSEDNSEFPWAITKSEFMQKTGDGTTTMWKQMKDAATQAEAKETDAGWILFQEMKGIDPNSKTVINDENSKFFGMTGEEVWTKFMNQLTFDELKTIILYGGFNTTTIESIERPNSRHCDDMMGLSRQGVHSSLRIQFGDSPVNAATWNKQLQYERGKMVAECGLWSGVVGWYGVGGNLHRTAFGGRNPEYYGEDPYLMGHISGAHGAGAEAHGLITYVKHNGLNESETGRYNRHTYVTEQAAREIYFKSFQICLEEYKLKGTMTSYNNIGDRQSASNHAYQWNIMREEWGFMGLSLTDAVTPKEISYTSDMMVRAGGSQVLANISNSTGDNSFYDSLHGTYDAENNKVTVEKRAVKADAEGYELEVVGQVDCYTQWYYVRMAALHTLYAEANSSTADRAYYGLYVGEGSEGTGNPYETEETPKVTLNEKYTNVTFKVGVALPEGENAISVAPATLQNADASSSEYTYIIGEVSSKKTTPLPAGLVLDEQTGKLTGTPTEAGTTQFAIWGGNLQGGWVRNVQIFTITIEEADEVIVPEYLTEEEVKALINQAIEAIPEPDLLTEEEVQTLINAAVNGKLTETQVKALIDAAIAENNANTTLSSVFNTTFGCSSAIGLGSVACMTVVLIGAVVALRKKED